MRSAVLFLALLVPVATSAHAQDFSGDYTATNLDGATVTLSMRQDAGGSVTGTMTSPALQMSLQATVNQGALVGTVTSSQGGLYLSASLQNGQLIVSLAEPDINGNANWGAAQQLVFTRQGAAPAQPRTAPSSATGNVEGQHDPNLIGVWSRQEIMNSGDASFAIEEILQITADGVLRLGQGRMAGGGPNWSAEGGPGSEVVQGYWRTENQLVFVSQMPSGGQWMALGRYYVEGATMLFTADDGTRHVWHLRSR